MAGLSKENPLKDVFNERVIRKLAQDIKENFSGFNTADFVTETVSRFPELGFLERSHHVKEMLHTFLPADFPAAADILIKSLGPELPDPGATAWDAFVVMAECALISEYGKEHYDVSMKALYEMTKRFSAEGDLRTFIEVDFDKTMTVLHSWCDDPNPHVRRLVSEGTRPRLPLSGRIPRFQKDPKPVIKLLDRLKDDQELYVRRSVANNINDIAKDNPDIAIATLRKWRKSKNDDVQWIVRHASRSLIKQGNIEALVLLGYSSDVKIDVTPVILNKKSYEVGEKIELCFSIKSQEKDSAKLMIDYVISYTKAKGSSADKVFKMRDIVVAPETSMDINKSHWLRNTSGRTHYPGPHTICLQINGIRYPGTEFIIY